MIEIIVTTVIMATVISVTWPGYRRMMEQGRSREAIANLQIIYKAQKAYFAKHGGYYPFGPRVGDANGDGNVTGADEPYFPGNGVYIGVEPAKDFDNDGDVDGSEGCMGFEGMPDGTYVSDYSVWCNHFGIQNAGANSSRISIGSAGDGNNKAVLEHDLGIDLDTTNYNLITVTSTRTSATNNSFTAQARRSAAAGAKSFTINQTGTITESGSY